MIVELREKEKVSHEEESAIKKIIEQTKINEKERIKNEKILLKQAKIDEKNRLKEEKEFKKREKTKSKNIKNQDEKIANHEQAELIKEIEEEKKLLSKGNDNSESLSNNKQNSLEKNIVSNQFPEPKSFNEIVKRIREKNSASDYPDINNTPN